MKFYKRVGGGNTCFLLAIAMIIESQVMIARETITTFIPRSQGSDTARELVGWQRQLFQSFTENYCAFATTIEYTHSFKTEPIARHLFSTTCLTFAGSLSENRTNTDIIADYFGLPTDFRGTLAIKPRIENAIIDLNFYCGLDDWLPGLYLRVHAPIAHTRWTLGLDECLPCADKFRGCTEFPGCYMFTMASQTPSASCPEVLNPTRVPPPCPVNPTLNPPVSFKNVFCTTQSLRTALNGNFTFGDMVERWKFGRFDFCTRSKTGLADIDIMLGQNIIHNDNGHFGFFGVVVVPTGNRPKAKYIFEPIVGNGRHWEVGAGFNAHFGIRNFGFYLDGYTAYVFKTHQTRSFDFRQNGLLSRYILLKEFDTDNMYTQRVINAINFATRNCEVAIGLKADWSAKICLGAGGWTWDIGYNVFFQDSEKICIRTECPCAIDSRRFGIKGLEGVCATCDTVNSTEPICTPSSGPCVEAPGTPTPLNTTQPTATMFTAQLPTSTPPGPTPASVCFSWNSEPLEAPALLSQVLTDDFIFANVDAAPTIINCSDLDPQSAAQGRMLTHKIFSHLSYTFERSCYSPHVGIGCSAEFDAHCDNALQQWAVWLKAGLMF